MSNFSWEFTAKGADSAQTLINKLTELDGLLGKLTKSTKQFSNATDKTATDTGSFTQSLMESVTSGNSFTQSLTSGIGALTGWGAAVDVAVQFVGKLIGGLKDLHDNIVKVGAPFEKLDATFKAFAVGAGATPEIIQKISDNSFMLGKATEYSTSEMVQLATTMVKAGADIQNVTQFMDDQSAATDGATAAGIGLSKAYTIGSHASKIYAGEISGVREALQMQLATSSAASTDLNELDRAMKTGGDRARSMGMTMLDFNSALALMAEKGYIGSQAANMLTKGFSRLVDGTASAKKAMSDLGLSAVGVDGQIKNVAVVFQELQAALATKSQPEQITILKQLFGESQKALIGLVDAGQAGFDAMNAKIQGALDTMQRLKDFKADTIDTAMQQYSGSIEAVWLALTKLTGTPIAEFWNSLAEIVGAFAERLNALGEKVTSVVEQLTGQGKSKVDAWLEAIRSIDFGDLWNGLVDSFRPAIETLTKLFMAGMETFSKFLRESLLGDSTIFEEAGKLAAQVLFNALQAVPGMVISAAKGTIETVVETVTAPLRGLAGKIGGLFGKDTPAAPPPQATAEPTPAPEPAPTVATPATKTANDQARDQIAGLQKGVDIMQAETALTDKQEQVKTLQHDINTAMDKTTLKLMESGAALQKWLLEPFDKFKSAILSVKEKFGALLDTMKGKSVNLAEKFGLISGDAASQKRAELAQKSITRDETLLKTAQTDEEKSRIQQRLSEKYAAQAEGATDENEKKRLAQEAVKYEDAAIGSEEKQQEKQLKAVEIERKLAEDQIKQFESMLSKGGSAAEQAQLTEKLQGLYQQFGNVEGAKEAAAKSREFQITATKEEIEDRKRQLDLLSKLVEIGAKQLEILKNPDVLPLPPEAEAAAMPL